MRCSQCGTSEQGEKWLGRPEHPEFAFCSTCVYPYGFGGGLWNHMDLCLEPFFGPELVTPERPYGGILVTWCAHQVSLSGECFSCADWAAGIVAYDDRTGEPFAPRMAAEAGPVATPKA